MQKRTNTANKGKQYWQQIMNDWKNSGMQITSFCRMKNLALSSFYTWRQRLQKIALEDEPNFIPVELKSEPKLSPKANKPVTLHLPNGMWVSLERDFDLETLGKLIKALGVSHANAA